MSEGPVPQELADKVLLADARNIVQNVGSGTPLTGPQRELMERHALTPEKAMRDRAVAFIDKWRAGQTLTPEQWREVHAIFPEFATTPAPAPPMTSAPAGDFALRAEPEPVNDELTKVEVAHFMELYGVGRRQLFRWKKEGAPLRKPEDMPGWWKRSGHTWDVPEKVQAAAVAARTAAADPAPPEPSMENPIDPTPPPAAASVAPGVGAAARSMPVFNLHELQFDPNELVANAARRVAALDKRIAAAYAGESTEDADVLESKLLKAVEGLRKLKDSDQKMKLAMGQYTLTADVERDLATLVELLRQMDETEARRVDELCPGLPQEARAQVRAAILRVGEARRRIFRKLGTITSVQDALLDLAAA